MRVLPGSRGLTNPLGPSAVAIGIFDGVHRGHAALLGKARQLSEADGIESVAYSFHPHPAQVLAPESAPPLIEPLDTRLERIAELGVDTTLIEPFNTAFAGIEAEQFVSDLLVGKLGAKHVIVGDDFAFGHKGKGDLTLLSQLAVDHSFKVHPIAAVMVEGQRVSSSRIRELIGAGDVVTAAELLNHPFTIEGAVVRGAGRGAGIGFATANVRPENELLPAVGVYAGRCQGGFGERPAVINVGHAPTFGPGELKIEAHILDFESGPMYGQTVCVDFVARVRGEKKFDGIDSLKAQIARDVESARGLLGDSKGSGGGG